MEKEKNIYNNKGRTRIGETKMMNNGQNATIIAYRNANDIDVKMGEIVIKHTKYQHFSNGTIKAHTVDFTGHLKEKKVMNNGQTATIVRCGSYYDIDIRFDDGTIVTTTYLSFRNGSTINPNNNCYTRRAAARKNIAKMRIGETRKMKTGLKATIIAYRNCHDMDVELEDGRQVNNISYYKFKDGKVIV